MMGCFFSLNRRSIGSIKSVERINDGKKTRCLPAVSIYANAPLAIGRKINNAAIHHNPPIHSPIPAITPLLLS
jgi:hypothetical protein